VAGGGVDESMSIMASQQIVGAHADCESVTHLVAAAPWPDRDPANQPFEVQPAVERGSAGKCAIEMGQRDAPPLAGTRSAEASCAAARERDDGP